MIVAVEEAPAVDPRSIPMTVKGARDAWSIIERTWRSTFSRIRHLPESALHENVNGEWSFVETQRHLVFATDVWIRRSILDDPAAYHRLGMPPEHRTGQPAPTVDVSKWGIDIWATPGWEEILEVRTEYVNHLRGVLDGLTPETLSRAAAHNPPWVSPTTPVSLSVCLSVVIREEWEHHGFAIRDLAVLERRL